MIMNSSFSSNASNKATITNSFLSPFHPEVVLEDPRACARENTHKLSSFFCPDQTQSSIAKPACIPAEGLGVRASQEDAEILKAAFFMEQIKDKHKSLWDFDLNLNPFIFLK